MFSLEPMKRINWEVSFLFVDLGVMITAQVDQIGVIISLLVSHCQIKSGGSWLLASNVRRLSKDYGIAACGRINGQLAWTIGKPAPVSTAESQQEFGWV